MKRISMEVPWKLSASDEIDGFQCRKDVLTVPVYAMSSRQVHQEFIQQWEAEHGAEILERIYNESAGRMLELSFYGVSFFCINRCPNLLLEDEGLGLWVQGGRFHELWDASGICPDPGFYRLEASPLIERLGAGRRAVHWMLAAHDEELHILGLRWESRPL